MKTLIPAVALLLGGAAILARGEEKAPPSPREPLGKAGKVELTLAPVEAAASAEPAAKAKAAVVASRASAAAPTQRPDPNAGLTAFFKSELALTEDQASGIGEILEDRARAVAGYEAEVHDRGWFRLEDFNHRIDGLRFLSYRRMESLLDAEQARKFAALWPVQLLAKDCIVVSLPEEKVVALD